VTARHKNQRLWTPHLARGNLDWRPVGHDWNQPLFCTSPGTCSFLLALALLGWPGSADAQEPAEAEPEAEPPNSMEAPEAKEAPTMSPEEAALAASTARDLYCTDVAGVDVALQSSALGTVNEVWTEVIKTYKHSRASFLLYWRGVLAQCLDQEFRAAQDLQGFLAAHQEDTSLGPMVLDAQRRIRVLKLQTSADAVRAVDRDKRRKASLGLGIGLTSATAVFTSLALWQRSAMDASAAAMLAELQHQDEQNEHYRNGVAQARNATVLFSLAAGMAVGSLTSLLWSAAEARTGRGGRMRPRLGLGVAPHPLGGASASLELRW